MAIKDPFGRSVTQARMSLNSSTDCNFRCKFCHKEGIDEANGNLLAPEEIGRITCILRKFGVDKVKFTGGEPMLRKDIMEIVGQTKLAGVKEISLTTNGTNLVEMAKKLKDKGLNRVNISLHSLKRDRFKRITGVDRLDNTIAAITASIEADLLPVKLNTTMLRGCNEDEIKDLVEFSYSMGGSNTNVIQIIELLSIESKYYDIYHYPLDSIEFALKLSAAVRTERSSHRRPKYELPNGVIVEIVRPMHNTEFCMGCNRIRVTYDGKFKPCLLRNNHNIDFLTPMRKGAGDSELIKLFKKAISLREPFFTLRNTVLQEARH